MSDILSYPHAHAPKPGTITEVANGVLWARATLPFALDHVNFWLLADGDGWTVVDTGFAHDPTRELWEEIFRTVLEGRPIRRILVTHFHPDHLGLADWLARRSNAELWMSRSEWLFGRMLSLDHTADYSHALQRYYRQAGLDDDLLGRLSARGNAYARSVAAIPAVFRRICDNDVIQVGEYCWHVIVGAGHSPEHVCLFAQNNGILIAGDQILPRISPNVAVWPNEPEANPLQHFLSTLDRLRALPPNTLVLPSHGLPFIGLHGRVDSLKRHHAERLAQIEELCKTPRTACFIMRTLFARPLDLHETVFALGEVIAHINYLLASNRLNKMAKADEIWLYVRA